MARVAVQSVDSEALMERMNSAREKAEEMRAEKSRLTGELETHEKRLHELEDECKKKFSVAIKDLPAKVVALKAEAEQLIQDAEALLSGEDDEETLDDE